jgi:hypothetical protein
MGLWQRLTSVLGLSGAKTRAPLEFPAVANSWRQTSVPQEVAPVQRNTTKEATVSKSATQAAMPATTRSARNVVERCLPEPALQTAPPNRMGSRATAQPARRVNIGLDFGTSTTKVVVRIDEADAKSRFLIVGPSASTGTVLFTSSIAVTGSDLVFGAAAEASTSLTKARSFKMNLPAEAGSRHHAWRGRLQLGETGLSAEDVSTLYLAWVLREVLGQVREALSGLDLKITINAAAPLDQMQEEKTLKDLFHSIIFRALKITHLATHRWPIDEARRALAEARSMRVPQDDESPVTVFPETHAAMTSYMLLPGRQRGNYATVDVGAGSTDVAFFWFHAPDGTYAEAGPPELCYYGASSEFVGMDDVDRAVANTSGLSQEMARTSREAGRVDLQANSTPIEPVLEKVYRCYRTGFGRSYERCPGEREWQDRDGRARYTLCLVGGGCLCEELVTRLRRALPHFNMTSVDVEVLRVPDELPVLQPNNRSRSIRQVAPGEQSLLLLAHGLANRAVDIPVYETGHSFGHVVEIADRPSHEEIYAR